MRFLTSESDISIQKVDILYFYNSDQAFPISEMMFPILSELDKNNNIICIDLFYFKKMYKRFNIEEIPTILIMKDGVESKRITGIPTIKDMGNSLKRVDISKGTEKNNVQR